MILKTLITFDKEMAWYYPEDLDVIFMNLGAFGRKNVGFDRVLYLVDRLFLEEFICIESHCQGVHDDDWCLKCPIRFITNKMEMFN